MTTPNGHGSPQWVRILGPPTAPLDDGPDETGNPAEVLIKGTAPRGVAEHEVQMIVAAPGMVGPAAEFRSPLRGQIDSDDVGSEVTQHRAINYAEDRANVPVVGLRAVVHQRFAREYVENREGSDGAMDPVIAGQCSEATTIENQVRVSPIHGLQLSSSRRRCNQPFLGEFQVGLRTWT